MMNHTTTRTVIGRSYVSKTDGTIWQEQHRSFEYNAHLGESATHTTLVNMSGDVIRLSSTDEDGWNDLRLIEGQ